MRRFTRKRESTFFRLFNWVRGHNFLLLRPSGPHCARLQRASTMDRVWENPSLAKQISEFEPRLMNLATQCQQLAKLWSAGKPLTVLPAPVVRVPLPAAGLLAKCLYPGH